MNQLSRRDRQAQETRREIVAAARRLFASQGYGKTTVAEIARAAGVSVQTIYDSLGSKAAVARQLNDLVDEEGGVGEIVPRMMASEDPRELIALATSISRNICTRSGDIMRAMMEASTLEPDLAALYGVGMERHRGGMRGVAARLAALGALREDVDTQAAADVMAALSEPRVVFTFVDGYGWSVDDWHRWVTNTLCDQLLR